MIIDQDRYNIIGNTTDFAPFFRYAATLAVLISAEEYELMRGKSDEYE